MADTATDGDYITGSNSRGLTVSASIGEASPAAVEREHRLGAPFHACRADGSTACGRQVRFTDPTRRWRPGLVSRLQLCPECVELTRPTE